MILFQGLVQFIDDFTGSNRNFFLLPQFQFLPVYQKFKHLEFFWQLTQQNFQWLNFRLAFVHIVYLKFFEVTSHNPMRFSRIFQRVIIFFRLLKHFLIQLYRRTFLLYQHFCIFNSIKASAINETIEFLSSNIFCDKFAKSFIR